MANTTLIGSASEEMEKIFTEYPEKFSIEIISAYHERRIIVGMDTYLAKKTAGVFQYRVDVDRKWPKYTNPLRIIYA